ncbi:MAG TPA: YceH family protein [Steroidobacteraceae bacterium]
MANPVPTLSLLETRVLGTLIEKQHTVPDTYPLTLNALVTGCNQKSSRSPVIEATEAEVQAALDSLRSANLIIESSGGRVARYSHNFERVLQVPSQAAALLTVLMLRGPQTVGELRINSERLHKFADISAVEAFLQELAARPAGALVVELPRVPGARENRWAHLLSGMPKGETASVEERPAQEPLGEIAALKARIERLEGELAHLKALVERQLAERT